MSVRENLKAGFTIPGEEELKGRRPWEEYWQRNAGIDEYFLRDSGSLGHPSRFLIAREAAKIGGSVLECGCATAIDYVLHRERGLKYSGVDITPKFVEGARKLHPGIDVRLANVLDLPFEDESFDTVYCKALLEHMHPDEWPHGIVEMWRVARAQMIICLYKKPGTEGYKGPLLPPRPRRGGSMYSRKINQQHLEKLLLSLPRSQRFVHVTTPKAHKQRMNWIWMVPKR